MIGRNSSLVIRYSCFNIHDWLIMCYTHPCLVLLSKARKGYDITTNPLSIGVIAQSLPVVTP